MASFTSDVDLIVIMLLGTSRQSWQVAVPHLVESRRTCACGKGSSQYQEIPSRGTAPSSEASHRNAGCQFPVKTDLCPLSSKWTWRCCGRCESDASCKYMGKEGQKPVTKCSRHISELFRYIPQFRIFYANSALRQKTLENVLNYWELTCWCFLWQIQRCTKHT